MDDYDIPFDGMSEDEFMYRAMNEDDPMYMGGTSYIEDDHIYTENCNNYEERVANWYDTQFAKILDAVDNYMTDPDDDPKHYFDDINYDPFPEK